MKYPPIHIVDQAIESLKLKAISRSIASINEQNKGDIRLSDNMKNIERFECKRLNSTHGVNTCISRLKDIKTGSSSLNLDKCVECPVGTFFYWDDVIQKECA